MRKPWPLLAALALVGGAALTGFLPGLRLEAERRAARSEGMLGPDPAAKVPLANDARAAYDAAAHRYVQGWGLLGMDFARQIAHPAPHALGFLRAMRAASERPALSAWLPKTDAEARGYIDDVPRNVQLAAQATLARAKGEADLAVAARMAAHLAYGQRIAGAAAWAALAPAVFDAADRLRLDRPARARLAAACGPPPTPLAALRARPGIVLDHAARVGVGGWALLRTTRQIGYLRTWRRFLAEAVRAPDRLPDLLRRQESELRREDEAFGYVFEDAYVLAPPSPGKPPVRAPHRTWAEWAEDLARADRRLEAER